MSFNLNEHSQSSNDNKYVYILLSETPSRFGQVIRRICKIKYNHASIAFDEDLKLLYSFARRKNRVPLNAGLVKESCDRFSLRTSSYIAVKIYKIPVTRTQYALGKWRIRQINYDPDGYLYNLFSVLTFPLTRGFGTYKAFSCAEFVVHMIRHMGIEFSSKRENYQITPEEIGRSLNAEVFFEGNLLEYYGQSPQTSEDFFERPRYVKDFLLCSSIIARLIYRKCRHHKRGFLTYS